MMVCGYLLNTVREVLATAPGINVVKAAVVRFGAPDVYGNPRWLPLVADFSREKLDGVTWETAPAPQIVFETSNYLRGRQAGREANLQPLDLSNEPDIARLLEQLDISELETDDDAATSSLSAENATLSTLRTDIVHLQANRLSTARPCTRGCARSLWIFGMDPCSAHLRLVWLFAK